MENKRIANNVFVEDEKLLNAVSSKWPAMVVSGKKLTEQQAAEVLIRTDYHLPDFSYAGNDKHHARRLNRLFNFPDQPDRGLENVSDWNAYYLKVEELKNRLGVMSLEYVGNAQIVSSWVGGPHGWCNWNGDVFCNSYNIGKWPEVREVAAEWGMIAEAFPFLDLRCQLFRGETGDDHNEPVVEFVVSQGVVVVTEQRGQIVPPVMAPLNAAILFGSTAREQGIMVEELKDKLTLVYGEEVPQF